ncbi:MAG: hypothetical protein PHW42_03420 [Patescibacteria group bacterium]|nr:hypothetical protein [Patescibacteria group bacterium]MDD4695466.1 hypothetical protein [Patescibacteria group bacterium]
MTSVEKETVNICISLTQKEEDIKECKELAPLLIGIMSNKGWQDAKDKDKATKNLIIFIDENNQIQMQEEKA